MEHPLWHHWAKVGGAHQKSQLDRLADMFRKIPPPSLTSRVLKLTIKASLLGLFVWGCVRILPLPPFSRDIARGAENSLRSLKATVQGLFQVWSLFAVYVICGYLLLVLWVTNGDSWDILTKCRIQGLETVNDVMDCAIFNGEVRHAGPDCLDFLCAWDKIEIISLSSEGHERAQLILSDVIKERNHRVSNENVTLVNELGMRTKGNGHEIKGKGDFDKGKKVKREVVGREMGIGLGGGGGGGCGRDDEDNCDPPDHRLDDKTAEDSSHEEEDSEREMDEPIDNYFHPLPNIFYIPTNVPGPGADVDEFESAFQGCTCAKNKNDICNQNCQCVMWSMGPNYDDVGFLLPNKLPGNIPVFECSEYCDCSDECGNRKVQFGPMTGLTIFETSTNADVCAVYTDNSFRVSTDSFKCTGKGLGLRTLKHVSKGSFICEYAGEIIGREEAFKRWRNDYIDGNPNYILALQEWISQSQRNTIVDPSSDSIHFLVPVKCVDKVKTEEHLEKSKIVTYIDPTRMGNIGRYANHSCDPNAIAVTVRVGNPVPRLCLFAVKDIMPGEEVTFDYAGLQIGLPSEVVDASSAAKRDPQWEKQNCSSSVCILPDLHSNILEEKCGNTCDDASVSVDGIIDGNLSKRLKFHVPLQDDGDSVSQNNELEHRRTLCLCGTKNCRKYLPFSKNWM
ncbi:hypothetical protein J437_LFUL013113 [Ladona fulva]|uniref:Uncharacterized protein n=1 Tax=Ladona fulva TaxID=123851 RepID=A0A8K0P852_LADFU|nr:hypothetical protein J437_LFUL013113 [Ladona fulva]